MSFWNWWYMQLSEPGWSPHDLLGLTTLLRQRRQWHPTPVLLPGKSHGQRSLVGCRPWGRKESDMTEWLHFHFSLSCIGDGNGNPFQCSCLENPRDGGAWWAAVYGVAQSRTQLKQLSSRWLLRSHISPCLLCNSAPSCTKYAGLLPVFQQTVFPWLFCRSSFILDASTSVHATSSLIPPLPFPLSMS